MIVSVNDPPAVNKFSVTGNEDETISFSDADFKLYFKDKENDELTKI